MFALDGKFADLSANDLARRNTIAFLLQDWDLLKIKDKDKFENNLVDVRQIKILTHKEKDDWQLIQKYTVGSKKKV